MNRSMGKAEVRYQLTTGAGVNDAHVTRTVSPALTRNSAQRWPLHSWQVIQFALNRPLPANAFVGADDGNRTRVFSLGS